MANSRSLDDILDITANLRKVTRCFTLEAFYRKFHTERSAQIAPFNRKEVEERHGTPEDLFYSIAMKFSIGMGVGYWNGMPTVITARTGEEIVTIHESAEAPFYITDWGHRSRWVERIFEDLVSLDEATLADLKTANPVLYDRVMKRTVLFEITCNLGGEVPLWYAKEEYALINRNMCPMTNGELLRSATEGDYNTLLTTMINAVTATRTVDDTRDKATEWAAALVNGCLANDSSKINTKTDDVTNHPPLTPESIAFTQTCIAVVRDVEASLAECLVATEAQASGELVAAKASKNPERIAAAKAFGKSVKEWKKRFHGRKLLIALDGPFVHSLLDCPADVPQAEHFAQVKSTWIDLYKKTWTSAETWSKGMKDIRSTGPNNRAGNFTKERFAFCWNAAKSIARPRRVAHVATGSGAEAVPVVEG